MSKLVNFKKRSISLPLGCKDLIDLLEPAQRQKATELLASGPDVKATRDDSLIDRLYNIGRSIGAALESEARMTVLAVSSLDDQLSLDIHRMDGETLSTSVTFNQSPENERKMKAIFERLGLQTPRDSGIPGSFLPDQPVQLIYRIGQESVTSAELTKLASTIFQDFCGLEPDSEVRLHFMEFTDAT